MRKNEEYFSKAGHLPDKKERPAVIQGVQGLNFNEMGYFLPASLKNLIWPSLEPETRVLPSGEIATE